MIQNIIDYKELEGIIKNKKLFIVCSKREKKRFQDKFENAFYFCEFNPNPVYEEVKEGIKHFIDNKCEIIIAIGGGSAIDIAKCVKLYNNLNQDTNLLSQEIIENEIQLIAIPTTAGSGSEATRFAVVYKEGIKQSITHNSILPKYILYDKKLLDTLPIYQRMSTTLDSLSHGIESIWSINYTDESLKYAKQGLEIDLKYMYNYFNGDNNYNDKMLEASMLNGKAINITKTTAGHALCYKLTTLYNISHGHATMLVNAELYPYMLEKIKDNSVINRFRTIASIFGFDNIYESKNVLKEILYKLNLYDVKIDINDLDLLVKSVNIERLNNNPLKLEKEDIKEIYVRIIRSTMK